MNSMIKHHAVLLWVKEPLSYDVRNFAEPSQSISLPQFGINDVRALISSAYRRPVGENLEQTLVVATEFITEEAQQALLKIVEEPPLSTSFIFVLPQGYTLLPTLLSRFEQVDIQQSATGSSAVFEAFLHASIADRFSLIEAALKTKDQTWLTDIKRGLVGYLLMKRIDLKRDVLLELEYVVRFLLTRGASNKFLLEHAALSLPLK